MLEFPIYLNFKTVAVDFKLVNAIIHGFYTSRTVGTIKILTASSIDWIWISNIFCQKRSFVKATDSLEIGGLEGYAHRLDQ